MKKSEEVIKTLIAEAKLQGMNAAEMAERIGCTKRQIHYVIRGERGLSIDLAEKALNAFGKTMQIIEKEKKR